MRRAARKLIDEALALPEDERELAAIELMASLEATSPAWEEEWGREIERRVEEIQSGRVALRSWDQVKSDLLDRLSRK